MVGGQVNPIISIIVLWPFISSLLQSATAYFISKCDGLLLQSTTAFLLRSATSVIITKCDKFIKKCERTHASAAIPGYRYAF